MSELNPPWAIENDATHHANVARMLTTALASRTEGVAYGMSVAQRGAGANMSVDVAKGLAIVFGDENEQQGSYGCVNDATTNVVIAAADPSNPRDDLIVARVRDSFYSGASDAWDLFVVQGTAAASPADPTVPDNALTLARVRVGAAVSSILTANITDLRPFLPRGFALVNSARRPGTLYGPFSQEPAFKPVASVGLPIYQTDDDEVLFYTSAGTWRRPWRMPWGQVGYAISPAADQGGITTLTDITGLSVTFIAVANRVYKLTLMIASVFINSDSSVTASITDSANVVQNQQLIVVDGTTINVAFTVVAIVTPSAGSVTYKGRLSSSASATIDHDPQRSILIIEDVGPSGAAT